jgi:hypothetical protein
VTHPIFPTRPLPVLLPRPRSRIVALLLALLVLGLGGGMAYLLGPDLVRDIGLGDNIEPATSARVVAGRCRSKLIIHFCDATIERRSPSGLIRQETHFGFFDLHFGSYSSAVVQKRGNPAVVTTTLALDHLWNRLATAALFLVLFGAGGLAVLKEAFAGGGGNVNKRFKALHNTILAPVLVDVHGHEDRGNKGRIWRYRPSGPSLGKEIAALLPPGSLPFMLNPEGTRALAVIGRPGTEPLLLDHGLSVLGLTDDERQALFGWQQSVVDRAGGQPQAAAAS